MQTSKEDVRPYTLVAELTYKCPLRCPYCANPTSYRDHKGELTTAEWAGVFSEARALGVLQLHLTGGEPLARRDLEQLVVAARALDLYTNLITSGIRQCERCSTPRCGPRQRQVSVPTRTKRAPIGRGIAPSHRS